MNATNLIESFSEFKEFKNIDRETMMNILEDVFRSVLIKQYVYRITYMEKMSPFISKF